MCITTALIPSYCPSMKLVQLVKELEEHNMRCVCVNDGSPEEYDEIFDLLPENTVLLKHETNLGKGAALKTGMKWIGENIRDGVVISADGDGQHLPEDILNIAEEAKKHGESLVLGARSFTKQDVPARSYYGNKLTEKVFTLISGIHVSDTQSGLRAFQSSLIPRLLGIKGERYEYEINELLYCAENGIRIIEIPIETVYEGNNECSHFHMFRDSLKIYGQLMKFSLSSFASFLIDTVSFTLFNALFTFDAGMAAANVCARVISASFNYECNRQAVFKAAGTRKDSLLKYFGLAALILLCNTCILYVLHRCGLKALYAKILTEMILFFFSFAVQKNYVFKTYERKADA